MHTVLKEEGHPVAPLKTLLAMVEGSVGTKQFLSLYTAVQSGRRVKHIDVIGRGRFACAYYASSILMLNTLSRSGDGSGLHTTVNETVQDMIDFGWYMIDELQRGAVVIWSPKLASDGQHHRHIGFYVGRNRAVSTDGKTGMPTRHHVTYGTKDGLPVRPIEAIYFHERLLSL
jgi:hypothetical protein